MFVAAFNDGPAKKAKQTSKRPLEVAVDFIPWTVPNLMAKRKRENGWQWHQSVDAHIRAAEGQPHAWRWASNPKLISHKRDLLAIGE